MLRAVDLFAGCGGLSKGFELAGVDVVAAVENWQPAVSCYEANFDHPVHKQDLGDVDEAIALVGKYEPDLIIGGPPCQDFSQAGKRIEAARANLTYSFAKIVAGIRPKYFVMENVARAQKSNTYTAAREIFKNAGYGLTEKVLTASYCGVPQRRKRFFCIGSIDSEDGFLDAALVSNQAEKEMTVRDYLGDQLDTEFYYRHPRNYNRRGVFSIDEPAPTMRGVNRPIPNGYPGHPNDACKIGPEVRPLTTLERSLIQTFPPDFKWLGSKTDREQMIGNAVPVNLGRFVAETLIGHTGLVPDDLNDCLDGFKAWLVSMQGLSERSAASVVSRLLRANSMLPLSNTKSEAVYLGELADTKAFGKLSDTVRSQLKGAVRKFYQYRSGDL